jgi:ATP-dependent DNA ligase
MTNGLCMLATDWAGEVPAGGMMVEEKFDGIRAMYFRGVDGVNRLWSRNGYIIEGTGHIQHRLSLMERVASQPLFLDGEFVVDSSFAATKAWFERGWKSGNESGTLYLFDLLLYADWKRGRCDTPLHERKKWLESLFRSVEEDPALSWDWRPGSHGRDEDQPAVVIVPDQWANDADDAIDIAHRVWARGGEGCMLKDAEGKYERGRSIAWQKLKSSSRWLAPRKSIKPRLAGANLQGSLTLWPAVALWRESLCQFLEPESLLEGQAV